MLHIYDTSSRRSPVVWVSLQVRVEVGFCVAGQRGRGRLSQGAEAAAGPQGEAILASEEEVLAPLLPLPQV